MKKTIIHLLSLVILLSGLQSSLFSQEKLKIAVIPKSNTALFWKSVHVGVKLGVVALGDVEVVWRAPIEERLRYNRFLLLSSVLQKVCLE